MGDQVFFDGVIDHLTRHRFAQRHDARPVRELGARRGRRARRLHHQLAAHLGAGHAVARPGGGRRASYAAGGPPGGPAAHHPGGRGRRRLVERPHAGARLPGDRVGRPARGQRGHPRRLRRELGRLGRRTRPRSGRWSTCCPAVEDDLLRAGIWDNLRSGYHHGVAGPRGRARRRRREPSRRGHRGLRAAHDALVARLGRAAGRAGRGAPACTRRRSRRSRRPSPGRVGSWRRSAPSSPRPPTSTRSSVWAGGGDLPEGIALDVDLRWRVLVRLATLGAVDLDRLDAELAVEPTGDARVSHAKARASLPDRGGQGLGVVLLHRRDRRRQLRAQRRRASACGAAARSRSPGRTSTATSPTSPRRSRCAAAGCSRDAAQYFFPRTSLEEETLERAQALVADGSMDLSLRRRLADEADDARAAPRRTPRLPR